MKKYHSISKLILIAPLFFFVIAVPGAVFALPTPTPSGSPTVSATPEASPTVCPYLAEINKVSARTFGMRDVWKSDEATSITLIPTTPRQVTLLNEMLKVIDEEKNQYYLAVNNASDATVYCNHGLSDKALESLNLAQEAVAYFDNSAAQFQALLAEFKKTPAPSPTPTPTKIPTPTPTPTPTNTPSVTPKPTNPLPTATPTVPTQDVVQKIKSRGKVLRDASALLEKNTAQVKSTVDKAIARRKNMKELTAAELKTLYTIEKVLADLFSDVRSGTNTFNALETAYATHSVKSQTMITQLLGLLDGNIKKYQKDLLTFNGLIKNI